MCPHYQTNFRGWAGGPTQGRTVGRRNIPSTHFATSTAQSPAVALPPQDEGAGRALLPGGCFIHPLRGAFSLSGGCSEVVSRGIRFVAASRGSNPRSRFNPQAAPRCSALNRGSNPSCAQPRRHSTSTQPQSCTEPSRAPESRPQARRSREKNAQHNSIQIKRSLPKRGRERLRRQRRCRRLDSGAQPPLQSPRFRLIPALLVFQDQQWRLMYGCDGQEAVLSPILRLLRDPFRDPSGLFILYPPSPHWRSP